MLPIRLCLLTSLLLVTCYQTARAAEWRQDILTTANLTEQQVEGNFAVLPDGGPDGSATIEFASPVEPQGTLTIDLSGVALEGFDQLHFDLWMEHEPVNITATLRGYPDEHRGRRWYVMKRHQPLNQWTDIRLDLDLDDDLSRNLFEEGEKSLVLAFARPVPQGDDFARARIHNVRLVRNPVKVRVDYRKTSFSEGDDGLRFTYPVELTNVSDQAVEARLELLAENLQHFRGSVAESATTLAPGQEWRTTVTLEVGANYRELPTGHAERAQVRVTLPAVAGYDAVPIRGYRPVYLFGLVPPRPAERTIFFEQLKATADGLRPASLSKAEKELEWVIEMPPPEVIPAYGMSFRCPECSSLMDVDSLYVYYCYSRDVSEKCKLHQQRVTVDPQHRLFPSMVDTYHIKNATIAQSLALAWLHSGDARFGQKAFDILSAYEKGFRELSMVAPASTGFHNRFRSATLHERHVLDYFAAAYLILRDHSFDRQEELQTIADGLLLETLHSVNLHNYGFSASQVDMITQTMKAAVITGRWAYFADAISGDGGIERIMDRTFDADGVGMDGGDYARQATRQILQLSDFLQQLGLTVNQQRIEQIRLNNALMGHVPLPADFTWETTVLPATGFTFLVNGSGDTWRRASINWGSNRERGAHDFLTTVFHDQNDAKLLLRTRRIAWGRSESFFSYESVSQNIPVIDEGNIRRLPMRHEYLRSDEQAAGVIISDYPERPAYPQSRLSRTLVLFEGCLLILDRVRSTAGERQFDFPVYGLSKFASLPDAMTPFEGTMGETPAYRLPTQLKSMPLEGSLTIDWADGDRGLRMHMLGDASLAFAGVSLTAWQANQRDFLMLRARGEAATSAQLYEATSGEQPRVTAFTRVPVQAAGGAMATDDQAICHDVSLSDGRTLRVLVSIDGGSYTAGECVANAATRIAIHPLAPAAPRP